MTKIQKLTIVFLLSTFYFLLSSSVSAATLYLIPQSQTVYQQDSFIAEVRLDTEGKEINAVEINLKFLPDLLKTIDLSRGGSILTLWVKEPSIEDDLISFIGGMPGGFKGEGLIGKIIFLGKEISRAGINFQEDSKVLLNDGKGTPAKLSFLEGNYEIVLRPVELVVLNSPSNPDQNKWYLADSFEIHWKAEPQAEYSYILSRDPLMEPDEKPETLIEHLKWEKMDDEIYYFQLKEKLPGKDWSKKVTYRFMIDTTLPEEFKPEIGRDPTIFEGKYFLSFATTDKTSGVDYYEVKEGKRDFKKVKSPYLLEDQSLKSKIVVKAIDKAGNEKIAQIIPPKKSFPYWIIPIIFILTVIIGWIIYKLISSKFKVQKLKSQLKT